MITREEKLVEKNAILESILESTFAGYWDWYIQEDYEYLSPSFKRMFGYEDNELDNIPNSWQQAIHPEDLKMVMTIYQKHIDSKGIHPYHFEARYFHKNGSIVWIFCQGKVIEWDELGKPVRMVGSHIDITHSKQVETKLNLSNEILELTNQLASVGGWRYSIQNQELFWTSVTKQIHQVTSNYKPDILTAIDFYKQGFSRNRIQEVISKAIKKGETFSEELEIITAKRNHVWVRAIGKPHFKDGICEYLYGTFQDITVERNKRDKLQEDIDELELLQASENAQMVYAASHDLKEPLRTIHNYAELLQEDYANCLPAEAQGYLSSLMNSSVRMQNLITGLLGYSRIDNFKNKTLVDSQKILSETLEDLFTIVTESNAIVTHSVMPVFRANATGLKQLFLNLISNAIKYRNEEKTLRINIKVEEEKNFWKFSVKDNGIGIAKKHFRDVFLIFKRLHNRHKYEGAGIGLAICKKIVLHHQGKIWVDSEEDKGSTFYFTLRK
ncbi:MAG: PAS domain-containing protein [Bacteroidota bacterium]